MAEALFSLKVLATNKTFYNGKARYLVVHLRDGEFELQAHHESMIAAVEVGEIRICDANGEWITGLTGVGVLRFANNRAEVLVETCERPDEIDELRAKQAMERAQERLRQKESIAEYRMSQASLSRAMYRLKYKHKYTKM